MRHPCENRLKVRLYAVAKDAFPRRQGGPWLKDGPQIERFTPRLRRAERTRGVTRRDAAWRINASADNAVVRSENYLPARLIRVQMKPHITRQESSRYDAVTR